MSPGKTKLPVRGHIGITPTSFALSMIGLFTVSFAAVTLWSFGRESREKIVERHEGRI